jgi:HSP20 family protein
VASVYRFSGWRTSGNAKNIFAHKDKEGMIMIFRRPLYYPGNAWRSPFNELERMKHEMDRVFRGLYSPEFQERRAGVFPLVNVTEDSNIYYLRAELPGLSADALNISATGNNISISGERKIASEGENARYHRREREAGTFNRVISLPDDIDVEKINATLMDGVLTVVIPKSEKAKPRQIKIS